MKVLAVNCVLLVLLTTLLLDDVTEADAQLCVPAGRGCVDTYLRRPGLPPVKRCAARLRQCQRVGSSCRCSPRLRMGDSGQSQRNLK